MTRYHLVSLALAGALGALPMTAAAQVSGTASAIAVRSALVRAQTPTATLPADGGFEVAETQSFAAGSLAAARWLMATTTGTTGLEGSTSQSIVELEDVTLLGGAIRADHITAVAASWATAGETGAEGLGSGFVNLVINGTPVTEAVAPNTRVSLPGVGYAVLNEQVAGVDGSMAVTMVRVVLTDALTGATIGEIAVGAARAAALQ